MPLTIANRLRAGIAGLGIAALALPGLAQAETFSMWVRSDGSNFMPKIVDAFNASQSEHKAELQVVPVNELVQKLPCGGPAARPHVARASSLISDSIIMRPEPRLEHVLEPGLLGRPLHASVHDASVAGVDAPLLCSRREIWRGHNHKRSPSSLVHAERVERNEPRFSGLVQPSKEPVRYERPVVCYLSTSDIV